VFDSRALQFDGAHRAISSHQLCGMHPARPSVGDS